MKPLAGLVLATLLCLSAAGAEVPAIIGNGFEGYKASGSKGALSVWLRGSALAPVTAGSLGIPTDSGPGNEVAGEWGPMESYEILAVFSPAARLRRVYAVAYFPQGPLFCCFDLVKASGVWTTYGLRFSVRPDDLLPADLLEKAG